MACARRSAGALLIALAVAVSAAGQDSIDKYHAALRANAADSDARRALRALIDDPGTSLEQYERIRDILRQFPWAGTAGVTRDDEPGQKLRVSGAVRDASGNPVAGALVHVFQTDASSV